MLALARQVGKQTAHRMVHPVASARRAGPSVLPRRLRAIATFAAHLTAGGDRQSAHRRRPDRPMPGAGRSRAGDEARKARAMTDWAARLDALPRLSLDAGAHAAHPRASGFRRRSAARQLWFKRDDLLPVGFGGNKVRSLDLIVADALRQGADTLVTGAGPLSNHVRASAAVSALCGPALRRRLLGRAAGAGRGQSLADLQCSARRSASPATLTALGRPRRRGRGR